MVEWIQSSGDLSQRQYTGHCRTVPFSRVKTVNFIRNDRADREGHSTATEEREGRGEGADEASASKAGAGQIRLTPIKTASSTGITLEAGPGETLRPTEWDLPSGGSL